VLWCSGGHGRRRAGRWVVESGDLFLAGFRREKSACRDKGGDSSTDAAAGECVTASR